MDKKDRAAITAASDKRRKLVTVAVKHGQRLLQTGGSPQDLLVLGVLNKNSGHSDIGDQLIERVPVLQLSDPAYLGYLKAVIDVEEGRLASAERRLRAVRKLNPYALEPNLLLINLLGHQDFKAHSKEIAQIAVQTANRYDHDKYSTGYGLLAIHYRVGSQYFAARQCRSAESWFTKAYDSMPVTQKYFGDRMIRNQVQLGIANSQYCQGRNDDAETSMNEILNEAGSYEAKMALLHQYLGFR